MTKWPTFEELARLDDDAIDVALGAALIAKDSYDALDIDGVLEELASLGDPLAAADLSGLALESQAEQVSACFRALGFRGNSSDYYDPRNSLLPDVLERKVGIPISLSLVWCAMAKRAGVFARGVGFPGHFLIRVDADPNAEGLPAILVDAYDGGRVVDSDAATLLLRRALGEGAELDASLLSPAKPRAVLLRMLSNLKAIYAARGEHARAFVAIDRMASLEPSARVLRERAAAALYFGATELARTDLARVIELEPQAPDVPLLAQRLSQLGAAPKRSTLH